MKRPKPQLNLNLLIVVGMLIVGALILGNIWINHQAKQQRLIQKQKLALEQQQLVIPPELMLPDTVGTLIAPAADERPEEPRALPRAYLGEPQKISKPRIDILGQLRVKIENEFENQIGITEEAIRAAADDSYERVGIANGSLTGYTLIVRPEENNGANTRFIPNSKRVIVSIAPVRWQDSAAHEMTHVLQGSVTEQNWVPGFLKEFIATSAEEHPKDDFPIIYERFNRPILAIAKSLANQPHQINANNAPLDGLRYDLLRSAGVKLGLDKWRQLAKQVHEMALRNRASMALEEFKPLFDAAGIGDCVLFETATQPGLYVDVAVLKTGIPLVLYKQIDTNGVESAPMANFRTTWRKQDKVIASFSGGTLPTGVYADESSLPFQPFADTYEIVIGTTVYTYKIENNASY